MTKININTCTLLELDFECKKVKGTTFGHNMIGLMCNVAEKRFGKKEAEKLCKKYQR